MMESGKGNSMENRNREQDRQTDEEEILKKLFPAYVSLYRIELNSGKYEILRLEANTNARRIVDQGIHTFVTYDDYARKYADTFIREAERDEFIDWHTCRKMKERLIQNERITYHYHSISAEGKDSYYEAYAVRGNVDDKTFSVLLGYRNVDSILYKEKAIQEQLQRALDEAKLSNEIISAIGKAYQYVSRIDIQRDWFEEISNRDKEHLQFIHSGHMTANNKRVCRMFVAEEYQEAFFQFTNVKTLPDRMAHEETIAMEYRMKDGSWHKLRFIEKKRDDHGRLTHVLCAIRCISDEKKREQILLHQVAEAKEEAAIKTRFLSNMSHDIRTPLNGIMGMIDVANRYPEDLEMQQKCRDKVMEASRYLLSMMNDILDMNKLESGAPFEQKVNFDLTKVLNRANIDKQMQAEKKQITYAVDWTLSDLKHIYLMGNPFYLERLLTVIADNAVKFTQPGGSIHVWCVEKSCDGQRVVYEFGCLDNGVGMSETFIAHAFEMFSQENETSRTKYEGTGLGLAIAKKIAERMGGVIDLESQKGHGTTVTVTMPFEIGKTIETEDPEPERYKQLSLKGMRALVAEDNELNMEIVKFILEEQGLIVEPAVDGIEAVRKFENAPPGYYQVILMDIMMPNMNGWDAARKIRAMQRADARGIPIIAMSANAFTEDIINSRISGMNRHLTKPLDASKLLDEIAKAISILPGSAQSVHQEK